MFIVPAILATVLLSPLSMTSPLEGYSPQVISQTTEVEGWNNVTWGMSETDVAALYPSAQAETRTFNNGLSRNFLIVKQYSLGNYNYQLIFGFDSDRLGSVALRWDGDRADSPSSEILEALKGRYGNPDGRNSIGALEWYLPRTKINFFEMELDGEYGLSVSYAEAVQGF